MAVLTRITDFIPNTLIVSQEVDDEFNQLVNILSGVSTNKDALIKYSHATDPVLRVDQLGAGKIQSWLQNGSEKANITNAGLVTSVGMTSTGQVNTSFNDGTNPALNVNQIGAGLIERWQNNGTDRASLSALGRFLLPAGIGATPSTDQISNFGTYFVDPTTRATIANTSETDLSSKTVAANTFAANGDFMMGFAEIAYAANANTKRYRLYFGGNVIYDTTALGLNGVDHMVLFFLMRTGATSLLTFIMVNSTSALLAAAATSATAPTFSNSNILKSTGLNGTANANDIQQRGFIVVKGSV